MSERRSDNRLELHPKPVQEYERRFNGTVYVDWDSFAQMEAVYDIAYRTNKYFWINGVYYQCDAIGSYRAITTSGVSGMTGFDYLVLVDASIITFPQLDGKIFLFVIKGATPYNSVYIEQNNEDLDFTTVGGAQAGETITIFYK